MNEKVKNIILGSIYSIVLFLILSEFIGRIVTFFERLIYPQEGKQIISMIPGLISMVVTIILTIIVIYIIIHFVTLARIYDFLKPNKFKIVLSVTVLVFIFGIVFLSEFGLYPVNYYLKKYLLLNSNMFSFEFMELLFPIIGYYIIFCTIDYFMKRKIESKEQIKLPEQKSSIKGPLIIIGIVLLIVIALFAVTFGFIYFKSKAQCGEDGMLIGSANKGYYCGYQSICEDCQNASQCHDCTALCESKDKIKRDGVCGPSEIDLTGKLKRTENGQFYVEDGPINCYCCCDEKGGN